MTIQLGLQLFAGSFEHLLRKLQGIYSGYRVGGAMELSVRQFEVSKCNVLKPLKAVAH